MPETAERKAYRIKYYQEHKEEFRKRGKLWYEKNKKSERFKKLQRMWRKKYYYSNRKLEISKSKARNKANRERINNLARLKYATPEGKAIIDAREKRYKEKNRNRLDAKWAVRYAIVKGELNRMPCVKCGNPKSEAHHEDYSKPLEVIWLCKKHHEEHHGKNGSLKGGNNG
jgi:hypothetical protein